MMEHMDAFLSFGFSLSGYYKGIARSLVILLVCSAGVAYRGAYAQAPSSPCISAAQLEKEVVFHQALATVSTLSNAAVDAYQRGAWRPTGSFRQRFFSQAGAALTTIRALLEESAVRSASCNQALSEGCPALKVPKEQLLEAFDQIFEVSFPKSLRQLRHMQSRERGKFAKAIDSLPESYVRCG